MEKVENQNIIEEAQPKSKPENKSVFKMFYSNCFKTENFSVLLSFVSIALTLITIFIQMVSVSLAGYVFYVIFYMTSFISVITALFIEAAYSLHKKEFKLKLGYFLIIFAFALLLIIL